MSIDPSEMERDSSVTFADGTEGRVYTHPQLSDPVPSASTVKDTRIDPEKKEALDGWRDHFDGSTQARSPHHEAQTTYYQCRGTLVHYAVVNALDQTDIDRGEEEYDAQDQLRDWQLDGWTDGTDDAYEKCLKEIDWALAEWRELREDGPIDIETVYGCEQYVLNNEWGYAGQYDLCYEQPDGIRILADFKTSSAIRLDHKLQLALYDVAIDAAVDRWQVIRLDPDDKEVVIEDERDWDRTKQGLRNQALSLAERTNVHRLPEFSEE